MKMTLLYSSFSKSRDIFFLPRTKISVGSYWKDKFQNCGFGVRKILLHLSRLLITTAAFHCVLITPKKKKKKKKYIYIYIYIYRIE